MDKLFFASEKEWLDARKGYLGASDASIIMGVSKWKTNDGRIKTPYLLWQEKLGLTVLDCDNSATRYGKEMEEPARKRYQEMVGGIFRPDCIINKDYPYAMVSLDGLNIPEDRAVEIKNCKLEDHILAKNGQIPEKYYPQVQMQAMVTGLPEIDYFSFHNDEGIIVTVKRDDEYIKNLDKKLKEFWDCVLNLKEPGLTDDDYIEQDDVWLEKAKRLYEVKQSKKALCEEEKLLEESLKSLSNDFNACSGGFRYTRSVGAGRVDYKSIPELLNVDLRKYTGKPIISWRLKKEK